MVRHQCQQLSLRTNRPPSPHSLASTSNTDDEVEEDDDDDLEGSLVGGETDYVSLLLQQGASEVVCQALRRHTLRHKRHLLHQQQQQQQASNVTAGTTGTTNTTFSHHSGRLAQEGSRAIRNLFLSSAPPLTIEADGAVATSSSSSSSLAVHFSREEEACAVLLEAVRLHTSLVTNNNTSIVVNSSSPHPPSHPSSSSDPSPLVLTAATALAVQWGCFAIASISVTPRRAAMLCRLGACDVMMDTLSSVVATGAASSSSSSGSGISSSASAVTMTTASDLEALGDVLQVDNATLAV